MLLNSAQALSRAELTVAIKRAKSLDTVGRSWLSGAMVSAYRVQIFRPLIKLLFAKLEAGQMHSLSLRRILKEQYEVEVGLYSYGPCLVPGELAPGTRIGRFCSFGPNVEIFRRNHPAKRMSLHPLFYDHRVGVFNEDKILDARDNPLSIENDVWVGARAIVLPKCRRIGNGSIIGACSVVTRDVPDFAIVAGNPAKVIGSRFGPDICEAIQKTAWWSYSLSELSPYFENLMSEPTLESLAALRSLSKQ